MNSTDFQYKDGDIFDEKAQALVNAVNCVGVMGRGVALAFKNKYQENFKAYAKACKNRKVKPGKMFVFELKSTLQQSELFSGTNELGNSDDELRYIYNFPTKRHWREKSNLTDIKHGLKDLQEQIKQHNIRSIAIPALGCGLGGLDWKEVKKLIEVYLKDIDGLESVVVFEPGDSSSNKKSTKGGVLRGVEHELDTELRSLIGARLKMAKTGANLTQSTLASAMPSAVSITDIKSYEADKKHPPYEVLSDLCKVLKVSKFYFEGRQVSSLEKETFRTNSKETAADRARAKTILIDHLERYLEIEQVINGSTNMDRLKTHQLRHITKTTEIDESADWLRNFWGLGTGPIWWLCELLENKGIIVVETGLPERIDGLTCRVSRSDGVFAEAVMVSNRMNVEQKRYTLAYELAKKIISSTESPKISMKYAFERFAGAFLVPGQSLRSEVGKTRRRVSHSEISHLKHKYGVSDETILMRLQQVGILSSTAFKQSFDTFAHTRRKTEPITLSKEHGLMVVEKPYRFERLVFHALSEELIAPARATELLNQPLEYVEQQVGGSTIQ